MVVHLVVADVIVGVVVVVVMVVRVRARVVDIFVVTVVASFTRTDLASQQ